MGRDMGPILAELEQLRKENKQLQEERDAYKDWWKEAEDQADAIDDECAKLKLTIQKALSAWECMEDFDDSITVIENMKVTLEQGLPKAPDTTESTQ